MITLFKKQALLLFLTFYFSLTFAQPTQAVTALDSSVYFVQQLNGLNLILSPNPHTPNLTITYYVKIGSVYENDSLSGMSYVARQLFADRINSHLNNTQNKVSRTNTAFNSISTTELTIYQLVTGPENYKAAMELLRDSIHFSYVSEDQLKEKLAATIKEIEETGKDYKEEYHTRLMHHVFRRDANLQLVKGDTFWLRRMTIGQFRTFFNKYYVPNNAILTATGKMDLMKFQNDVTAIFKLLRKGEFDPQLVTKIVDFKPMIYNERFVVNAPVQQPEIRLHWLYPGARSNMQSSYQALLLTTILNDPNNHIQVKARKLGCKKLVADYDASNFSGMLTVTIHPDKQHFYETYNFVLNELQRLDKTVLNETMMNAAKLRFKSQMDQVKKTSNYINQVTKYWVYNEENYYPTVADSVFVRTEKKLLRFIIEYMNQSPHVTGLLINEADRKELKIDSLFVELDESISDYVFTYENNKPELEGAENLGKLNRLLQWAKANPDLIIQVNGYADKGEYNRFRDDSVVVFIDSIPTFERVKKEIIKTGSFRLEMLRALKIVKFLYDNGVAADRLKGTSMTYASKDRDEAKANRKCTIYIEKLKKAPSVYEYHYGKPKPK